MKKIITTLAVTLALIGQNLQAATEHVLLKVDGSTATQSYTVPAGKLAVIVYIWKGKENIGMGRVDVTIGGTTFNLGSSKGFFHWSIPDTNANREGISNVPKSIPIPGPATITLDRVNASNENFMVIKVNPNPNIGGVGQ